MLEHIISESLAHDFKEGFLRSQNPIEFYVIM